MRPFVDQQLQHGETNWIGQLSGDCRGASKNLLVWINPRDHELSVTQIFHGSVNRDRNLGVVVMSRYFRNQLSPPGPMRTLSVGLFLTTAGEGAWYTSWAIYFTKIAGLPPTSVGLGLFIAGAVAFLLATPIGSLSDRLGPRQVLALLVTLDGLTMAAFVLVHSFLVFLAISIVNTTVDRASGGVKTTYVAALTDPAVRTVELARQRVASHVGYLAGASAGAFCLAVESRTAFVILILTNAVTSLCYAGLVSRLPHVPGKRSTGAAEGLLVFTDGTFIAVMGCTAILSLCWGVVSTALPLWLAHNTQLPLALAAAAVIINSAGIATLQVVASRGLDSNAAGARRSLISGLALAAACVLFALTDGGSGAWFVVIVVAAALAHLTGELLFVAAKWQLTFGLTPPDRTGQYQGMAASVQAGAQMLSPVVMTLLITEWGQAGWWTLAVLFTAAGMLTLPTAHLATRRFNARYALIQAALP
jgi:MFS family permease